MDIDQQKRAAAEKSVEFVEDGMRLGLGTGSTANHMIRALAARVRGGLKVVGVPTSRQSEDLARAEGIPLSTLADGDLDLAIDGADEVDPQRQLIKGRGGALFREKIVAAAAKRYVIVADESKKVPALGVGRVPVEFVVFGAGFVERQLTRLGGDSKLRLGPDGKPFVTDEGNHIFDVQFAEIADPRLLGQSIIQIPGVVEHGLFIDLQPTLIWAGPGGVTVA